jgi:hypothetical protein
MKRWLWLLLLLPGGLLILAGPTTTWVAPQSMEVH